MQNMVYGDAWNKTRVRSECMPAEQKKYSPVAELRNAKREATNAIEELLELLPADDVRCGMVKVLGEWMLTEIEVLPADLLVFEKPDDADY